MRRDLGADGVVAGDQRPSARLPFVDAHAVDIAASPEVVWDVIAHRVLRRLGASRRGVLFARLLGCTDVDPPTQATGLPDTLVAFRVERAERPELIALAGEHRFATYALALRVDPIGAVGSRLTAETRAAFPGPSGRVYRAAVIGTRAHVLAVRRLLAKIRQIAERE
jgi:hypothetical protein